nr:retrovirus-related Pol polyprotein from transposon TNT 1-94 [Tanacetum cinerariifolium]
MTGTESDIEKFNGKNDFGLWQVRMKALLKQQGLAAALEELPAATSVAYDNVIQKKVFIALILCLDDRVLWEITKETTAAGIQKKLETLYMTKSLANRLYLKRKLYTFHMHPGKSQSEHIDEFHKLVGDLSTIDIGISDEDQALLLLTYLPSSFDNFVETLLYGRDTLKLEDVECCELRSLELFYCFRFPLSPLPNIHSRRYGPKDMDQDTYSAWYNHKKSHGFVRRYPVLELMENAVYGGRVRFKYDEGWVKFCVGQCQAVTRKTLKGRKQLGEYQTGWKIKIGNVLDFCNQRSTQPCTKSGVSKHLCVAMIQQQNGLVKETNMTLLSKTPIDMLGFFGWLASIKPGMLEPLKVKCIFLGYRKGTGSVQVLQRVEVEVEPQEDHTFERIPNKESFDIDPRLPRTLNQALDTTCCKNLQQT